MNFRDSVSFRRNGRVQFQVRWRCVIDEQCSAHEHGDVSSGRGPEPSQTDLADTALNSWLVTDALTQLTHEHRTVLVRAYYMGQSVADVAVALDLPPSAVKSRLHYGLRTLRLALQERGVTGR